MSYWHIVDNTKLELNFSPAGVLQQLHSLLQLVDHVNVELCAPCDL